MLGGSGQDIISGSEGADAIIGNSGDDILYGGAGDDVVTGNAGADELYGGDGNDVITYDDDDTVVSGGTGHDTLVYGGWNNLTFSIENTDFEAFKSGFGNDTIGGSSGDDELRLGAGNDLGQGFAGNDAIYGQEGDDVLMGFAGNDLLNGGPGADRLSGGAGDDRLNGGEGADTFVFKEAFGRDIVEDFSQADLDVIEIDASAFADFAAVTSHAEQVGADTVITDDANNSIALLNVALASLSADDFRFV